MENIRILDCTLRDGGYINDWKFGQENIKKVLRNLDAAGIDIVECGFINDNIDYSSEASRFTDVGQIQEMLPESYSFQPVCMMNYGEFKPESLPQYDGSGISGIRIAFHKRDLIPALDCCAIIKERGYQLFIQPMVSMAYSDEEFLSLIRAANRIIPYAFYIVDSFGVMKQRDLTRLFYLVEHNLDKHICIGYHSHNNLQLAYSNAQSLLQHRTERQLIIDSSVFGMGRGAGNLNTELFMQFMNESYGDRYRSEPLLQIVDQILSREYYAHPWGYSLPHYASAIHNCHPNYATWLDEKGTLTIEDINRILGRLDIEKRFNFDKEYIMKLYNGYLDNQISDDITILDIRTALCGKTALIIAPGNSIHTEREKIIEQQTHENTVSFSVNFIPDNLNIDHLFVSNIRRYVDMYIPEYLPTIITSNIPQKEPRNPAEHVVNYGRLLNNIEAVRDNAAMLLIRLLIDAGIKKILLAGLDGYSHESYQEYVSGETVIPVRANVLETRNRGMSRMLGRFKRETEIEFLTKSKFVHIGAENGD